MTHLHLPVSEADVRGLGLGDPVALSGLVYTGRDRLHKHLHEGGTPPVALTDGALYHCGPVVVPQEGGGWRVVAAGPTTSQREDPYMPGIIRRFGLRVILGKGGMGPATQEACRDHGCVYVQVAGGAAASLARCITEVRRFWFLEEFGATEAMWELRVERLEGIVGIDARGVSLFSQVERDSRQALDRLLTRTLADDGDSG